MSDQDVSQSAEARMMALLDAEDEFREEEEQPEVPQEEPEVEEETEEVEEEQEEEDSEEEQPSATVKLKVNGEEIEKPLDEVVALAQQGMDYTQKTQAVAEQRKQVEAYAQALQAQEQSFQQQVALQQALIQDIAQITALDQQIERFNQVNWQALSDSDPVEAQKLFFQYNQLNQQRQQMANQLGGKQQQLTRQQAQYLQEKVKQGAEILSREIPNWGKDLAVELRNAGVKEYGFSDEEMAQVIDPRHVKVLHDALQWRKLQANQPAKNKVAQAKPMLKPGSKDTKQANTAKVKQLSDALRKTGKQEFAQKLIERML